jgi:hypothetical protein
VYPGNQVRECLRRWATPPDPSTNHNIACGIQHGGTAQWFFRGGIFRDWKSTGSLLWIYGKRVLSPLVLDLLLTNVCTASGVREEHPLVSIHLALYATNNLRCLIAQQSFKTSKPFARQDQHLLPIFISTLGTLTSKTVATSSHLFSSNFLHSPALAVTYSTTFIWNMIRDHGHQAKLR